MHSPDEFLHVPLKSRPWQYSCQTWAFRECRRFLTGLVSLARCCEGSPHLKSLLLGSWATIVETRRTPLLLRLRCNLLCASSGHRWEPLVEDPAVPGSKRVLCEQACSLLIVKHSNCQGHTVDGIHYASNTVIRKQNSTVFYGVSLRPIDASTCMISSVNSSLEHRTMTECERCRPPLALTMTQSKALGLSSAG